MSKKLSILLADLIAVTITEDRPIIDITNDSRLVKKGSLFMAYPGDAVDGRDYISQAIANGAAAILYQPFENEQNPLASVIPILPIPHLKQLSSLLASRFYDDPSSAMTMIGITGTNGKTSCTYFIAEALDIKTAIMGTTGFGFLNQLQPSPLTTGDAVTVQKNLALLRDQGAEAVAMEVSSHALVQDRVAAVHFDIAVFTQLSRDHLDYHKTMENYAQAKELLFQHSGLRSAVINLDDELGRHLIEKYSSALTVVTYSVQGQKSGHNPFVVANKVTHRHEGFTIELETTWGSGSFNTPLLGRFNIYNVLAVVGVLGLMDLPFTEILSKLESLTSTPGRMQKMGGENQPLVIVDYAHTPDALEKTLIALREHCAGQLWCVFGCGGDRDKGKRPQMGAIAEQYSDHIIVTNDNPRTESAEQIVNDICRGFSQPQRTQIILDRAKAIEFAIQSALSNDIVLLAGKGHEDYQIIGQEKFPFSDAEQVRIQLKLRDN